MRAIPAALLALLLPASALAYPTLDRGALAGGSSTSDLAVSSDGRYIATSQRASGAGLAIWDRLAPNELPTLVDVCEATAVVWTESTVGDAFYVGCGHNTVHRSGLDPATVPPAASVGSAITVGTENESIVSLAWTSGDTVVHAISTGDSLATLHAINITSDEVDAFTGLPASVAGAAADLAVVPLALNSNVIGIQADGALLWASRTGTNYSGSESIFVQSTPSSIATDPNASTSSFFASFASTGEIWAGDTTSPGSVPTLFVDGLSSPQALAVGVGSPTPVVYAAQSDGTMLVFDTTGNELDSITLDAAGAPIAISPAPDDQDTVYVAAGDGTVRVVTDRPWVEAMSVSPDSVTVDGTFTITFSVDVDCSWDLRIDTDNLDNSSGSSLQSGSATASEVIQVALESSVLTREGTNRIVLFANDTGAIGVDSVSVTFDTEPDPVLDFTLAPGDGRIVASWTATDEEDISTYRVYVSDAPFTADDEELPSLSLESDGTTYAYPMDVTAGTPSTSQSVELLGLTNAAVYYVAVKAIDAGGAESLLSAVLSASPSLTCGLVECYGDDGCTCSTNAVSPRSVALWGLALVALGLRGRRRRVR